MNVLILGGGGREHALAWKIKQSPLLQKLYCAPGNAGTATLAQNIDIKPTDFEAVAQKCKALQVDMVVVGPEAPLVNGLVDYFAERPELQKIAVIGPSQKAARLEGSKDFSKQFMQRHGIPTAAHATFTGSEIKEAQQYLAQCRPPYVLKADGLAAGKGVLIIEELQEAQREVEAMLSGKFGEASSSVLIEEFLKGREFSVFALTDGKSYKLLPEAKDYKRIGEGDTGLNTGGMGAISPVPFCDAALMQKVEEKIVKPTIAGLAKENLPYKGFLFFGLIEVQGEPRVIEYNVRLGDPETEVVLPALKSDLLAHLQAVAQQKLKAEKLEVNSGTFTTVMAVSGGYPEAYEKGKKVIGIKEVTEGTVFHAGTSVNEKGEVLTSGGRVLCVTAQGNDKAEALAKSYRGLKTICYDKIYYRSDIAYDV